MKYIDAEKLIAEIKRFSATEYGCNTFGDDVANGALDYVLEEIIPSLQQEQPSLPSNLDEAAEESSKEVYPYEDDSHVYDRMLVNEAREYHEDGFKAGAKWMAGQGEILSYDEEFAPLVQRRNLGDKVIVQIRKAK